jgi:hypothetical protein
VQIVLIAATGFCFINGLVWVSRYEAHHHAVIRIFGCIASWAVGLELALIAFHISKV